MSPLRQTMNKKHIAIFLLVVFIFALAVTNLHELYLLTNATSRNFETKDYGNVDTKSNHVAAMDPNDLGGSTAGISSAERWLRHHKDIDKSVKEDTNSGSTNVRRNLLRGFHQTSATSLHHHTTNGSSFGNRGFRKKQILAVVDTPGGSSTTPITNNPGTPTDPGDDADVVDNMPAPDTEIQKRLYESVQKGDFVVAQSILDSATTLDKILELIPEFKHFVETKRYDVVEEAASQNGRAMQTIVDFYGSYRDLFVRLKDEMRLLEGRDWR